MNYQWREQKKPVRKLKKQEIEHLWNHIIEQARAGNTEDSPFLAALQVSTRIDFPLGELLNPEMRELVMILALTHTFLIGKITEEHRFGTQGIEGLISVQDVPLSTALLVAQKTGIYRIEIFVPHGWRCELLQDRSAKRADDPSS